MEIPVEDVRTFLLRKRWYLDLPACGSLPDRVTDRSGNEVAYLAKPEGGMRELLSKNQYPEEPDVRDSKPKRAAVAKELNLQEFGFGDRCGWTPEYVEPTNQGKRVW